MAYSGLRHSHSSRVPQTLVVSILRLLNRVLTGRVRFGLFLLILVIVVIFSVRSLSTDAFSSITNMSSMEFQDKLPKLKDSLEYAVMIDAGSSGSRVQIYVWFPHSGDPRELLNIRYLKDEVTGKDVFMKITPGLSSTSNNPSFASDYIEPLLDFAAKHVPESKHKSTALYILATAGMRLLKKESQEQILEDLRKDIPKKYKFLFDPSHFQVITGKEEGIYSWIALNYLTHKFDHRLTPQKKVAINLEGRKITTRERTIGMIEMGGASTQIAFEINNKHDLEEIRRRQGVKSKDDLKDVLVELNLGCDSHDEDHTYLLYVKTFLGLGANAAREEYWKQLVYQQYPSLTIVSNTSVTLPLHPTLTDPCLNPGTQEAKSFQIKGNANSSQSSNSIHVDVVGSGDFEDCIKKLKFFIDVKREDASVCFSNSSNCPLTELTKTRISFEGTEFYGFSEFFYSTDDILRLGGMYDYQKVKEATRKECSLEWMTLQNRYDKKLFPRADQDRLRYECFKASWMITFLHEGLQMPKNFPDFRTVYQLDDNTVQWTLGALIFKTRFIPLRSIYKDSESVASESHPSLSTSSAIFTHILFFVCMTAIIVSIIVYLRHLNQMTLPTKIPASFTNTLVIEEEPLMEVSVT